MKIKRLWLILGMSFLLISSLVYLKIESQNNFKENIKIVLRKFYKELKKSIEEIDIKIKFIQDKRKEKEIKNNYEKFYFEFQNPFIQVNPYEVNPLSAIIKFETEEPIKIELILKDKYSLGNNYVKQFNEFKTDHSLIVDYLYPEFQNKIELISENKNGKIEKKELIIKTESLKSNYPIIISKNNKKSTNFILLEMGSYGEKKDTL